MVVKRSGVGGEFGQANTKRVSSEGSRAVLNFDTVVS